MSQAPSPPPMADPSADRSPTLLDAWARFSEYDLNASLAQKRFTSRRKWLTIMGVAVTVLAVLHSTLIAIVREIKCNPFPGLTWDFTKLETWRIIDVFEVGIIMMPILTTVIYAGDVKSNMGLAWIVFRSTAEALKKEIYLYRIQVGSYVPRSGNGEDSRDIQLAKRIKTLGQRVMETQVNQTGITPYTGSLPPYAPQGDDGFSNMVPEDYLAWRLEDQFNYYRKKAARLSRQLSTFQWSVYGMGGLGILLASIQQEIWVAVSSSMAAAFTSFLEFNRVESTLISCNQAASDLYNIRAWWRALPAESQAHAANVEALVMNVESVIQAENAGWVQEMRDALAEVYGDKEQDKSTVPMGGLSPEIAIRMQNAQALTSALDGSVENSLHQMPKGAPIPDRFDADHQEPKPAAGQDLPSGTELGTELGTDPDPPKTDPVPNPEGKPHPDPA